MYADATLFWGGGGTNVPVLFLMQDKMPLVSLAMKSLSDAQKTTAIRVIPGLERADVYAAKQAKSEILEYVNTDPQRWADVKGHMADALPQ